MWFASYFASLDSEFRRNRVSRLRKPARRTPALHLEVLEDRCVPTIGVAMLKNISPDSDGPSSSSPMHLTNADGTLYFSATDAGSRAGHGRELWKSNGTPQGTVLVSDINPGSASSNPGELTPATAGPQVHFTVQNPAQLMVTNGTDAGTNAIAGIASNSEFERVGSGLFYTASYSYVDGFGLAVYTVYKGVELFQKDPTGSWVKDINPNEASSNPANLTNVNGTLFFTATDGVRGVELWKSNGTPEGTVMVKDIRQGSLGSKPDNLTALGNTLYFTANNGAFGVELWKSDGTAAGTKLVKDIRAPGSSHPAHLTAFNGKLYFTADDGVHGRELWRTNGTTLGTVMVKNIRAGAGSSSPNHLKVVNNTLYFSAHNGTHGRELWKTGGRLGNTAMVKDIVKGSKSSSPSELENVAGALYFAATNQLGTELWTSNGAGPGTKMVADIAPGRLSSAPHELTAVGGQLVFAANDGQHGIELFSIFDITVPVITNPGNQAHDEGDGVHLFINANDPGGDALTYSATGLPQGLQLNSSTGGITGAITNPAAALASPYPVVVTVTDGTHFVSVSFLWTITDPTVPEVTDPGSQTSNEGNTVSLAISAADGDGDSLTYAATGLPPGLTIDSVSGVISGTVGAQAAGVYQVTVSASDGVNTGSVGFTWTINDLTPPIVTNPGPQSSNESNTVSLAITATDDDGDLLNYTATNLPPGLTMNGSSGVISGTVGPQAEGQYEVTVNVSDGFNTALTSFLWTINDTTVPTLVSPGNQTSARNDAVSLSISASDPDGDPLTYSAVGLPTGLSIDSGTGLISGTVTANPGDYEVTVFADDGANQGMMTFTWTIVGGS